MGCDLVVVGLGYVGLPLARAAGAAGLTVTGLDVSDQVVSSLCAGRSHIQDVTDRDVGEMLAAGLTVTTDPAVLAVADTVAICVPTALAADGTPDLEPLLRASTTVAGHLRPGTLVVVESTSSPGTTDELIRPILERTGLVAGCDFYLAYSPERIDPGNHAFGISNTPKVVGGHTPLCAKRCAAFYEYFVDSVVIAGGTREAELAKLLENTYRNVNIALVNEFAMYCHGLGVDVWDVLRCAATKPFGFHSFRPGAGVGGHCIPVDPVYLMHRADAEGFTFRTVATAQQVNHEMPAHVARRVTGLLGDAGCSTGGAEVLLLGVSYKPDVADLRESPATAVARCLTGLGATVRFHDPYVDRFSVDGTDLPRARDPYRAAMHADISVLLQGHRAYDVDRLSRVARSLFDTTGRASGERVVRL
ncbi:nucleotide sugar dehydrogenase [Streptomyces colonosanans]|uniref:UDP-N-acetyl-D-glucosamine dehydrogenase n=1 Tax=Streptomyces colonosanans TaxID=1428652 RepID=A0A1S2PYK6_9ACTN|nr:nucleotide sugar dehydrogenase [Streptomyces colonosanans]OIJ98445.1 UDP-N-acetyl-D-glucosamine dehydrogenase [Streptomyces colonosanans]